MRLVSVCLFTLLSMVAVLPAAAGDNIEICHFSPGGAVSKAMTVSAEAAEWHIQKHGDHIGGCIGAVIPLSVVHVTDSLSNDVIVFNGDSNTQIATLNTKKTPLRVIAAPNREFVYIPNFNSGSVSVVSISENAVVAVVGVGSGPQNVVFTPDSAMAYVYNVKGGSVSAVQTSDHTVVATIGVGNGNFAAAFNNLAMSSDGRFVYVPNTADDTISVIETASNQVLTNVRVGTSPIAVAVTPDNQLVYVVNAQSPMSVIRTIDHTVIGTIRLDAGTQNLAITPDGQFVYTIGNSQFVQAISTQTNTVVATIAMDQANFGTDILIDPNSNFVYVPSAEVFIGNGALNVIDIATQSVVARVSLEGSPKYAAMSRDGTMIYIANGPTLDIVQTSDNSLVSKVNTGGNSASGVARVDIP